MRSEGLGFRVSGLGLRASDLGFRVKRLLSSGFLWDWGSLGGVRVPLGLGVCGCGCEALSRLGAPYEFPFAV